MAKLFVAAALLNKQNGYFDEAQLTLMVRMILHDTYHRRYPGSEVLLEIMQATTTGRRRINKYATQNVFVGGKTGTYDGPNSSPATIHHKHIRACKHVATLKIGKDIYGLSILLNTGREEDVAVLGGGLMREYLGVEPGVECE